MCHALFRKQTSALQHHQLLLLFRLPLSYRWYLLWDICLTLHAHLELTVSWAGLYITGRHPKCFWHVNVCFHLTSCHWFKICRPFCSIGHSFHKGHTVCILPLSIVISLVLPPSCIDDIFFNHVFVPMQHRLAQNKCIVTESPSLTRSYLQLHVIQSHKHSNEWHHLSSLLNREPPDIRLRAIQSLFE